MTIYNQLVKELDDQIVRLTTARNALIGISGGDGVRRKQRVMSADARERIAAAQRKRWARVKRLRVVKHTSGPLNSKNRKKAK